MNKNSKTATIILNSDIDTVFPLFTPIAELDWVLGWKPEFIYPESGETIDQMVFRTPSSSTVERSFLWTLSRWEPEQHHIEYMADRK
jgi:hypothetical protein